MIRKRSHSSSGGAKKEKAAQPETSNSNPLPWVHFLKLLMIHSFSAIDVLVELFDCEQIVGEKFELNNYKNSCEEKEQPLPSCSLPSGADEHMSL